MGNSNERDFMDRAELLCALGQTVVLSNCMQHKKLIAYFTDYLFAGSGWRWVHANSRISSGRPMSKTPTTCWAHLVNYSCATSVYADPAQPEGNTTLLTARTIEVPHAIHFLYDHLLENRNIVDMQNFNPYILDIFTPGCCA